MFASHKWQFEVKTCSFPRVRITTPVEFPTLFKWAKYFRARQIDCVLVVSFIRCRGFMCARTLLTVYFWSLFFAELVDFNTYTATPL